MPQFLGRATISVNGKALSTEAGASLDTGGVNRTAITTNKLIGYAEQTRAATVTGTVNLTSDLDVAELNASADVTITFATDVGQTWVVAHAFLAEPVVMTDGEGGKIPLTFTGDPAEKL